VSIIEQDEEEFEDEPFEESEPLDPKSQAFVDDLVEKIVVFMHELVGHELFPYQIAVARRVIESVIINDGEEISILMSRQSGKSETVADVVAALLVLLPKLATLFPNFVDENGKPKLEKFKRGFWVGIFAPTDEQADTIFSRIVSRLTSDHAMDILLDPEIDDTPDGRGKIVKLKKSGSFCRMQTAHPRAKIESKSYHLIVVDEAQHADEHVVKKSIHPMGAFYNASLVKLGTPDVKKGDFYRAIQHNKRLQTKRGRKQNHFEYDWKVCARYNSNYKKYVLKELRRLGEDSDEFRLSYALEWLLERGMFVTGQVMEELSDRSMDIIRAWFKTPVLVGIDPARRIDSTVVTVVYVDWDRPDEFGFYDHRILNWLELHGDDWERQYHLICEFLQHYNVLGIGVDAQGVGDAVAQRLAHLLPRTEVHSLGSNRPQQSERWTHLMELIGRRMVVWPGSSRAKRTKVHQRFMHQMEELEKHYEGPHLLARAPEEAEAHDDYPDSLALACSLTKEMTMPTVEVSNAPFYEERRRRYG
jgi:hypothetical protein